MSYWHRRVDFAPVEGADLQVKFTVEAWPMPKLTYSL